MRFSIIIPAYNEEMRIGKTLKSYTQYFSQLKRKKQLYCTLVIVVSGATDNTEFIVRQMMKRYPEITCLIRKKVGKGYAILEGFKYALNHKNKVIGFIDADGATPPQSFHRLINALQKMHADGIIASRYLPGSIVKPKQPFSRIIASRIYNLLVRTLFLMPYGDTQCGAKVFRRHALKTVLKDCITNDWIFDVDLLYNFRKHNLKIYEVPTIWADQKYSKMNVLRAGIQMIISTIRLRIITLFKRFF